MTTLTKYRGACKLVNMTKIVKLYEAKTHLSDLVERAARGEEFIIAKGDQPMARLIPLARPANRRAPGGWEGRIHISDDFDDPLPAEILRGFEDPE